MSRFYLVDHSLKAQGGHHFTYACDMLHAASSAGLDVVLAANRRLRRDLGLPSHWNLAPVFEFGAYDQVKRQAVLPDTRRGGKTPSSAAITARHASFRDSLRVVFDRFPLSEGDVVLFPAFTLFDVASLAGALPRIADSSTVVWNVQFHEDFLGHSADPPARERGSRVVANWLRDGLNRVPGHRLRFFTPAERLTQFYNRLNVSRFETLPHAVAFDGEDDGEYCGDGDTTRSDAAPVRVACIGNSRPEKGLGTLQRMVDATGDLLRRGRMQLLVQTKPARIRRHLPRVRLRLPGAPRAVRQRFSDAPGTNPIVYYRYPLPRDGYRRLLGLADVGLMLYDRRSYLNRCSGVMSEFLAAGKPVIAPGGCSLGDRLDAVNYRYRNELLDRLVESEEPCRRTTPERSALLAAAGPVRLTPPSDADLLAVRILESEDVVGTFKLVVRQLDPESRIVRVDRRLLMLPSGDTRPVDLLPLDPRAAVTDVCLAPIELERGTAEQRLRFEFLASAANRVGDFRLSGPGLSFCSVDGVPELLREMIDHFDHYRRCARRMADRWRREHDPRAALNRLLDRRPGEHKVA